MFKDSSSPVKANIFNPLSPDLLTLYRRLNPIKIWPTYAVPPTTTLCPRSTYDLLRAGSSPTIFQPVEKLIPLTTTSQSGPDQSPLYLRPTYALPDQGPLIADPSIFPERERAGVGQVSGVNGPLVNNTESFLSRTLHYILEHNHMQWHDPIIRYFINLIVTLHLNGTLLKILTFYLIQRKGAAVV